MDRSRKLRYGLGKEVGREAREMKSSFDFLRTALVLDL